MHILANADLSVSILDPIEDVALLGSRYCTGGYIWQVTDAVLGELISGPTYPGATNTFDGQGLPDMFHQPLLPPDVPVGGEVACIGVGLVRRTSPTEPFDVRHNPEVSEWVRWEIDALPADGLPSLAMRTSHAFRGWAYRLERAVTLNGRTVHSRTAIHSQGSDDLPVRWFAHPFWPLTPDNVLCSFDIPISMADNPGYFLNAQGFVERKPEHNWRYGWYQPLEFPREADRMEVVEKHPKTGQVITRTDFLPSFLPIWGNDHTFSFEPYTEHKLAPGESAEWSIEYQF